MLIIKNKIWFLLIVTLLAAYFAPPVDSEESSANVFAEDPSSAHQNTSRFPTENQPIKILTLVDRSSGFDSEDDGLIFMADFSPEEISSQTYKKPKLTESATIKTASDSEVDENTPPPLPFKMLGRYVEDGKPVVFLQHNDQNLVLNIGDIVLDKYKLEEIDSTQITFIYIPTNVKQTLSLLHQK